MGKDREELGLAARLAIGGIAGFVATMAMTSAVRHLHRRLPGKARDRASDPTAAAAPDLTMLAHFAYGAACGALIAAANPRIDRVTGSIAGGGIWLASHMGWIPAFGVLKPAAGPAIRRDAVMFGAHLAWGWTAAEAMRELAGDRATIFAGGPVDDAPRGGR